MRVESAAVIGRMNMEAKLAMPDRLRSGLRKKGDTVGAEREAAAGWKSEASRNVVLSNGTRRKR
jgi:hypothetical protein